ncbi:MAG: DMT family transporter [Spirochaetaceae bacterium]|jgi:drug/metabolite transporter (DMT)-like permease|nr:DMT family transporter [Spirochaetaceae bacterium]
MNKRALRADALLLVTAGLWGFGFVAQSSGMDYVGPFTYNGLRFPLGALSLLPLIAFRKAAGRLAVPPGTSKFAQFRMTLLAGLVLFTAVALQQIGIIFTTVGNAGFITGFYVVLTPVLGIFAGKKTGVPTWIGMVFALAGLYFIFVAGSFTSVNPGDLITVVSAFFWAVHILVIDNLVHKTDPLILSAGQFAWCGLFCIIAAFAAEPFMGNLAAALAPDYVIQQWKTLGELFGLVPGGGSAAASISVIRSAAVPILYGGLCSVGIAYTLQVVAQKDAPPAHATIILCLEGTFAAFGGMLLRDEKPGPFTLLGFAFMLCAMVITQWDVIGPTREKGIRPGNGVELKGR